MAKGKHKEEKLQKEQAKTDEDKKKRAKIDSKHDKEDNKTQSSAETKVKLKRTHEEGDPQEKEDSINKWKKSRKKDQTTSEAPDITTDEKEQRDKLSRENDKSHSRKLNGTTKEFAGFCEDGVGKENSNLSKGEKKKKKKELKESGSEMLQSSDEKDQSIHKHGKKVKKPKVEVDEEREKSKHKEKRFREDRQEINKKGDLEIVSDVDSVVKKKKKRKRKAEPENILDGENNKIKDIENLGTDDSKLSEEEADIVKKKKKKRSKHQSEQEPKPSVHPGLDYLRTWHTNRQHWNFKKVRQVWLLQNMFDQEQITDEDFSILLKYLEGLKGTAKEKTIEMAEQRIENGTDEQEAVVESRVRQVLQLLTE